MDNKLKNEPIIAGVCSNLANQYNLDVVGVRVIFIILLISMGIYAIFVYLLMMVLTNFNQ